MTGDPKLPAIVAGSQSSGEIVVETTLYVVACDSIHGSIGKDDGSHCATVNLTRSDCSYTRIGTCTGAASPVNLVGNVKSTSRWYPESN